MVICGGSRLARVHVERAAAGSCLEFGTGGLTGGADLVLQVQRNFRRSVALTVLVTIGIVGGANRNDESCRAAVINCLVGPAGEAPARRWRKGSRAKIGRVPRSRSAIRVVRPGAGITRGDGEDVPTGRRLDRVGAGAILGVNGICKSSDDIRGASITLPVIVRVVVAAYRKG